MDYKDFFIGDSHLAMLAASPDKQIVIANVTFEPGCRNNEHSHENGSCRKSERCLHFFESVAFLFAENDFLGIFSHYQEPCGFAVPTGILDKD